MRKLAMFIAVLLFSTVNLFAQNRTVTGKVTDDKDGTPLTGVSIVVKGTSVGTTSGQDGSYSISVPSNGKVLVFTFINFQSVEQVIGSRSSVNTALTSNEKSLQEVVVTGYSREKKSQFAGSAKVLSSKVVENVPVGAFDQALQGRVPGMIVNSGTGQPGASANITIRGISSISGAGVQPLYVIDGVPTQASDFQTLNPNDFESISVLKDAAAAALYGARGGLGVIVITTKKGKAGANTFTYRSQFGFTQPPSPSNFNMMSSSEALLYEERTGVILGGSAIQGPGWAYSKLNPSYALQTPVVQAQRDRLLDSFRNNNVNYYDLLFRNGFSQTHELNFSGGNDKTRFFISGGMFDQKGIDLNARLRRYTARFNLDNTSGKLTTAFNTTLGYSITNQNEGDFRGNSTLNPFQMVWRAKPYEKPYRTDGSLIFRASSPLSPTAIGNVLENAANAFWQERQIKINSSFQLAYKILPYLTLKNVVGVDLSNDIGLRAINANSFIGSLQTQNSGFLAEATRLRSQIISTSSAVYNNRFGKHDIEGGAYFEVVRGWQKGFGMTLLNLDPRLTLTGQGAGTLATPNANTPQNASSAKSGFGIRSYFATGRYTYADKYTLSANIRRDGTSRILNEANKEITTWSAGLTWNAFKERFMDNVNFLSDLRVRLSYGIVPNIGSIGTANFGINGAALYNITNFLGPQLPTFNTSTAFLGSTITGQIPNTPGNPDLKIENIEKYNIGFDVSMFKNRLNIVVDLYRNITKDLFVSQPLAATTGFGNTTLPINAGQMSNKGIEMSLEYYVLRKKDYEVKLGVQHSININNIDDLGLVSEYPVGTFIIREGLPYGSHYTQRYLGADPATGRPTYRTADGKVTTDINAAGVFAEFGNPYPKHLGGITLDARYKGFSLSALFSYQFEVYRYDNVISWTTRGIAGFANAVNQNRILLTDQWQKPGDVKYYQSPAFDRGFTSADIFDAKFIRFRNLMVSYTLPAKNTKVGGTILKGAKFYIQGQNLFIWSPWRGLDPEDNNNISLNEYPNPRAVVAGIEITF
jgi:TonB-linked SusC/RagA family outer membrane protein